MQRYGPAGPIRPRAPDSGAHLGPPPPAIWITGARRGREYTHASGDRAGSRDLPTGNAKIGRPGCPAARHGPRPGPQNGLAGGTGPAAAPLRLAHLGPT